MTRWWTYQKERFPILAHGPLVLAFSFSAVAYSAYLRGGTPAWIDVAVACIVSFVAFFQQKIARFT